MKHLQFMQRTFSHLPLMKCSVGGILVTAEADAADMLILMQSTLST
jgi:hypothetical protein